MLREAWKINAKQESSTFYQRVVASLVILPRFPPSIQLVESLTLILWAGPFALLLGALRSTKWRQRSLVAWPWLI